MPAERTTMRHVREVLRLKFVGGVPTREIARRIGVAPSTVRTTIRRFQAAGLSWPLPDALPLAPVTTEVQARAIRAAIAGARHLDHRRRVSRRVTKSHSREKAAGRSPPHRPHSMLRP